MQYQRSAKNIQAGYYANGNITPNFSYRSGNVSSGYVSNNLVASLLRGQAATDPTPLIYNPASVGAAITYTPTDANGFVTGYGSTFLNNGDVGAGISGTNYCTLNGKSGVLLLQFSGTQTVNNICIYHGYDNGDNGTYTITDWSGNTLFSYVVNTTSTAGAGASMNFWYKITPTATQGIRIYYNTNDAALPSFREIQIFG